MKEMQLKIEMGLINAISELFEEEEILEENTALKLQTDVDWCR